MMKKTIGLMIALALSGSAFANVESVKKNLSTKHADLNLQNIESTPIANLYSATLDDQIVYVNDKADYVLVGSMIRLSDQKNLTKDLFMKNNQIDWNKLPLNDAIKTVKGNGQRKIAVFSDPNCPFCKQLDLQLNQLKDVTIYTFVYPIKPQSVADSKQVFCEQSPALAWSNLILKGIKPSSSKTCENPIERNLKLGRSLNIMSTPTLIFSNGYKQVGALSAQDIEEYFKQFGM